MVSAGGVYLYQHGHEVKVSEKKIEGEWSDTLVQLSHLFTNVDKCAEEIDRTAAKLKEKLPNNDKQGSKPSAQVLGQKIDNTVRFPPASVANLLPSLSLPKPVNLTWNQSCAAGYTI